MPQSCQEAGETTELPWGASLGGEPALGSPHGSPMSLLPTLGSPRTPAPSTCPCPHLLDKPDDADGLLLAEGQGAGQTVELPGEPQGRKAVRGLGHAGAGGVAKRLPGAAGWVQRIQSNAVQRRGSVVLSYAP